MVMIVVDVDRGSMGPAGKGVRVYWMGVAIVEGKGGRGVLGKGVYMFCR